ncbi:hypothetical protein F4861DRAFT_378629 [Xylaria intraflava]|nr:hypothetical protein F4861DRAFT_378629 [Xylaria intraflava]
MSRRLMTNMPEIPDTDEATTEELWRLVKCKGTADTGSFTPHARYEEVHDEGRDSSSGQAETEMEWDESEEEDPWEKMERELLVAKDDDPLIPSEDQISSTWMKGLATWSALVSAAEQIPPTHWPAAILDPSVMLNQMPPLPRTVPRKTLAGRPTWRVSHIDHGSVEVTGAKRYIGLKVSKPMRCLVSDPADCFQYGRTGGASSTGPDTTPKALSILTLCWSYILSVRLLELQGRPVHFSGHRLQPTLNQYQCGPEKVLLELPASASPGLVRWLCAVLAPALGWATDTTQDFPPWASFCAGDVQFVICTAQAISFADSRAPSSREAMEYLTEFVGLYSLGPEQPGDSDLHMSLAPYTAGLLAALALPFYDMNGLQPRIPAAGLKSPTTSGLTPSMRRDIEQYYSDIPYYMTLSMDPLAVGSMVWSIFWQPGIKCNLVSPWLGSILSAIQPLIASRDLGGLAKVFMLRRPRVSLMWLGIFLLGDPAILDHIERYLGQLEERRFCGSLARPDSTVASWTGSRQSFWDEEESRMAENWSEVSRADVLRRRHIRRLWDDRWLLFSWEPFGMIARRDIEPELLEQFEVPYLRQYVHWTWLVADETARIQRGFRADTGRFVESNIPGEAELVPLGKPSKPGTGTGAGTSRLAPSKMATLSMLHHSISDSLNDRSLDIAAIPGLNKDHAWLQDWRGLE